MTSQLSGKVDEIKDKIQSAVESQGESSQQESEGQVTQERVPLLDKVIGGFQTVSGTIHNVSEKISAVAGLFRSNESGETQEEQKPTTEAQKPTTEAQESRPVESQEDQSPEFEDQNKTIKERIHNITERLSHKVAGVKSIFSRTGKVEEEHIEQEEAETSTPSTTAGERLHDVTGKISETVDELKQEQKVDELSKQLTTENPFEPLASEEADIAQPLSDKEQVGENITEMTEDVSTEGPQLKVEVDLVGGQRPLGMKMMPAASFGTDKTNVEEGGENQGEEGDKGKTQKMKEGLSDAGSKISQKMTDAKEKVQSHFAAEDKENATQIA